MDKKEAAETTNKILDQDERPILLYCYFYTLSFADIGKKLYIDRNTCYLPARVHRVDGHLRHRFIILGIAIQRRSAIFNLLP